MNLRIIFKFKDCKLQFYEKRGLFSYFCVNPRTPASRWRRLLKLKRININSFKIIIGFFFTPPLFLATKVAISFVYCSPKTIKTSHSPHRIYNSLLRMRAIHELKRKTIDPLTPQISLVILLTVCQMIFNSQFRESGISSIGNAIIDIFLYSHHLSA